MIFKKSERRKFPTILGITMGALAVVGIASIKNKGKAIACTAASKMKNMLSRKSPECPMDSCE